MEVVFKTGEKCIVSDPENFSMLNSLKEEGETSVEISLPYSELLSNLLTKIYPIPKNWDVSVSRDYKVGAPVGRDYKVGDIPQAKRDPQEDYINRLYATATPTMFRDKILDTEIRDSILYHRNQVLYASKYLCSSYLDKLVACAEIERKIGNRLVQIMEHFPKVKWDKDFVSENPNITQTYLQKHKTLPNDIPYSDWIGFNPNMEPEYVIENINIAERKTLLGRNYAPAPPGKTLLGSNIIGSGTLGLKPLSELMTKHLSRNPNVTPEFVRNHPEIPWNIRGLSSNPNFTPKFISENKNGLFLNGKMCPWDIHEVSSNPSLTLPSVFSKNPLRILTSSGELAEPYVDWSNPGLNPLLIDDHNKSHLDSPYNDAVWGKNWSSNPNITLDFVLAHQDWEWNMSSLSANRGITLHDVLTHPDGINLPVRFDRYSSISYYSQTEWDMTGLSANPNITMEFIWENPLGIETSHGYRGWNVLGLSSNPNLTLEYIVGHPKLGWNWDKITKNKFLQDPIAFHNAIMA